MPQYLNPPPSLQSQGPLEIVRELGHGGEGHTDLVKSTNTSRLFAVKTCQPGHYSMTGTQPREVRILQGQMGRGKGHPRILKMKDYTFLPSSSSTDSGLKLLLFYEYHPGGDLARFCVGHTSEKFLTHVFRQMASALAFLHDGYRVRSGRWEESWKRIVHCDIKPANIFLKTALTAENPLPDVVLGDFGLATRNLEGNSGGTAAYMPPELPLKSGKADVWALGGSIYHMAHGNPPIDDMPEDFPGDLDDWTLRPEARRPRKLPRMYSKFLNGLVTDCLQMERKRRITSRELAEDLNR